MYEDKLPNQSHSKPRIPIAVDCWFPTGSESKPKILMIKFKEPEGDIITIKPVTNLSCDISPYFNGIVEFRCEIIYREYKRNIIVYFYPKDLKWEMTMIN